MLLTLAFSIPLSVAEPVRPNIIVITVLRITPGRLLVLPYDFKMNAWAVGPRKVLDAEITMPK